MKRVLYKLLSISIHFIIGPTVFINLRRELITSASSSNYSYNSIFVRARINYIVRLSRLHVEVSEFRLRLDLKSRIGNRVIAKCLNQRDASRAYSNPVSVFSREQRYFRFTYQFRTNISHANVIRCNKKKIYKYI